MASLSEVPTGDAVLAVASSVSPGEIRHKIAIPPVHLLTKRSYFPHFPLHLSYLSFWTSGSQSSLEVKTTGESLKSPMPRPDPEQTESVSMGQSPGMSIFQNF